MSLQAILNDEALNEFPKIIEVIKNNVNKNSMIEIALRKMRNNRVAVIDMNKFQKEEFTVEILSHFKHLNYI